MSTKTRVIKRKAKKSVQTEKSAQVPGMIAKEFLASLGITYRICSGIVARVLNSHISDNGEKTKLKCSPAASLCWAFPSATREQIAAGAIHPQYQALDKLVSDFQSLKTSSLKPVGKGKFYIRLKDKKGPGDRDVWQKSSNGYFRDHAEIDRSTKLVIPHSVTKTFVPAKTVQSLGFEVIPVPEKA